MRQQTGKASHEAGVRGSVHCPIVTCFAYLISRGGLADGCPGDIHN